MKRFFLLFCTSILIQILTTPIYGYENVYAHKKINEVIVNQFLDRLPGYIQNNIEFKKFEKYHFGLKTTKLIGDAVTVSGLNDIVEEEVGFTAAEWIIHGGYSADEPEFPASLRHFYDPTASVEGKFYLTDISIDPGHANPAIDAIYWHFTGKDAIDGDNLWTWEKGKEYLEMALNVANEELSNRHLAIAMRCLGEVLHNTADMGCPSHVRNDAHGGYPGVGGADPYESLFNPSWVEGFGKQPADPDYAIIFGKAKKAENVNKSMAVFTNKNFFSQETISGNGVESYSNLTMPPDFPSPKLHIDFTYNSDDFGYYKTFNSGRTVMMCSDRSLSLFAMGYSRGRPLVTTACVQSQASELVPNIVEAGINVIRLFIPNLSINLKIDGKTGKFDGEIIHNTDEEYTSAIKYSGKVKLYVNTKTYKNDFLAKSGKFDGVLEDLKPDDHVVAEIRFADIIVKSPIVKANDLPAPVISEISPGKGGTNTMVTIKGSNFSTYGELFFDGNIAYPSAWIDNEIRFYVPNSPTLGNKEVYIKVGKLESNKVYFELLSSVKSITISPSNSIIPIGGSVQLNAVVKDANGNQVTDREIEWSSSSTNITVSNTGNVTGLETGSSATVYAKCEGIQGSAKVCVVNPTNQFEPTGVASSNGYSIEYSIEGLAIDESLNKGRDLKGYPIGSSVTVQYKFSGRYSIEGSWDTQYRIYINETEIDQGRAPDKNAEEGWTHTGKKATIQITDDIVKNGFQIGASIITGRPDGGIYLGTSVKGKGCK